MEDRPRTTTGTRHAKYLVIQPAVNRQQDPTWARTGTIISEHRTEAAAEARIAAAHRRLNRQPGMESSWYDWHIITREQRD